MRTSTIITGLLCLVSACVFAGVKINGGATYATIQDAVNNSSDGDVLTVSTGLYAEAVDINAKAILIDGGYNMDCVTKAGGGSTVIEYAGGSVVEITGSAIVLSNLEIRGGITAGNGGGLDITEGAAVTAQQCTIHGNTASGAASYGGGVNVSGSSLLLIDSDVYGNKAAYGGGGALVAADVTCVNCAISGNSAGRDGGGFFAFDVGAELRLENVSVSSNTAESTSAAGNIGGGGVAAVFRAKVGLVNCLFDSNASSNHAGAIGLLGSSLTVDSDFITFPPLTQPPNRFINNRAPNDRQGGAILVSSESTAFIKDALFTNNFAGGYGGAVYLYDGSTCDLVNVIVARNSSVKTGDGVRASKDSTLRMVYCTVASNDEQGVAVSSSCLAMTNCIVWGHSSLQVSDGNDVQYSDIEGGYATGTGNIDADPLFSAGSSYQLSSLSPCIDTGIYAGVGYDCIEETRPYGDGYDMGAYEWVPEPCLFVIGYWLLVICHLRRNSSYLRFEI